MTSAGNAAGTGARIALLDSRSRATIEALVRRVEKIETAIEPQFQAHFVDAMAIPHRTADYPQLRKVVDLPAPQPVATSASGSRSSRPPPGESRNPSERASAAALPADQTFESGAAALRRLMKSSSASSIAGSSGGATYSASCFFQSAFARFAMSSEPPSSHCS